MFDEFEKKNWGLTSSSRKTVDDVGVLWFGNSSVGGVFAEDEAAQLVSANLHI